MGRAVGATPMAATENAGAEDVTRSAIAGVCIGGVLGAVAGALRDKPHSVAWGAGAGAAAGGLVGAFLKGAFSR